MLLRFVSFTSKLCLTCCAAVTLSRNPNHETAESSSNKQSQVSFDSRQVNIPAFSFSCSNAQWFQDIDASCYLEAFPDFLGIYVGIWLDSTLCLCHSRTVPRFGEFNLNYMQTTAFPSYCTRIANL